MPDAVTSGALNPADVAPAVGPSGPKANGGALDRDAFLQLLVAQLKYQNPMSPTNPDQFLAQSAQFTMVEKLEEISKAQVDLGAWQRVLAGQGLVGRHVTGPGALGEVSGVVTGLKMQAGGPVLELAGGQSMAVTAVTKVADRAPTPAV